MSILEAVRRFLAEYPGAGQVVGGHIKTGNAADRPGDRALAPAGLRMEDGDILGGWRGRAKYLFYLKQPVLAEADRAAGCDYLEGFSLWVEEQAAAGQLPALPAPYVAEDIAVSGGAIAHGGIGGLAVKLGNDATGVYRIEIELVFRRAATGL